MHMPAFPILKYFFLKTHAIEKKSKEHTIHRIFGRKILQRI